MVDVLDGFGRIVMGMYDGLYEDVNLVEAFAEIDVVVFT